MSNMFSNTPLPKPAAPAKTTIPRTPAAVKKDVSPSGTVRKTVERNKQVVSESQVETDEFADLMQGDGAASISCSITKGVDFNSEKVTFFVNARCDQNTKMMDLAAERVLLKAMSYVNDAGELLGWKKEGT